MSVFGLKEEEQNDEVACYHMARYISSNEAAWRILNFFAHERHLTVVHLAIHLDNNHRVYFSAETARERVSVLRPTTLSAFFELCRGDEFASTRLFPQVPNYYTWDMSKKKWKRRVQGRFVVGHSEIRRPDALGRVYTLHPNDVECYFLWMLLHTVRGPRSLLVLLAVNETLCET
ncbi:uncharacterized protein LOC106463617 [Limulus polyphemus]|uniref:Uncharacterized protein LOC106463617 n=1 Tax=Limulus polyphemus TaxID=6850 RepID=A0ABM1BCA2_LIMPO|nr:uncharacterized protein LOC106463617 [Limulus polyphemus]